MSSRPEPEIPCGMFPPVPIDDLTLVQLYRQESDNDVVSEAIAQLGADVAIRSMQQRHRAHNVALGLRPRDLHQRAELLELLFQEFGIPEIGVNNAIETDADRGRYFRAIVLRLLEREVEASVKAESGYDDDGEAALWMGDVDDDNPNNWIP